MVNIRVNAQAESIVRRAAAMELSANPCNRAEDVFHTFREFAFGFDQRTFCPIMSRFLLGRKVKLLEVGERFAV
jgi:hypothetical protein